MPELPEVEAAVRQARQALAGRTLDVVRAHHASQRRTLTPAVTRALSGRRVEAVERHGKHQHVVLDNGGIIAVHFRMNGDWHCSQTDATVPRFARVTFATRDGVRLSLVDSRALCTVTYHRPGHPPSLDLGPEPDAITAELLQAALAARRGPIKPVLLDQRVVAGLGNIYAAEALWRAHIDPTTPANRLKAAQLRALVRGIKAAIADGFARQGRYREGTAERPFKVYDREDAPCTRCRARIVRITQAGRSTYYCAACQR